MYDVPATCLPSTHVRETLLISGFWLQHGPGLNVARHLGNEPADGSFSLYIYFSLSFSFLSPFQLNKTNKSLKKKGAMDVKTKVQYMFISVKIERI